MGCLCLTFLEEYLLRVAASAGPCVPCYGRRLRLAETSRRRSQVYAAP
jgi:hypothetical protein